MVETFDVSITPYGLTRRTFVYLPDDCQTSGKKYPVLYMFDGHNLFFDSTATYGTCWGLKEYCDAHPNWIIAAPECNHEGNKRLEEYCPYQSDWFGGITGTGHEYMEWLTKEFKPMMDKRYPTLPGRANTAIGGSSMGGLMSLYALLQYNDTFSRAAALSPSIWVSPEKLSGLVGRAKLEPGTVLYMDYGSREMGNHDGMRCGFAEMCAKVMTRGIHLTSRIVPGGTHSEASWEKQLPFMFHTLMYEVEE
mgnify:FL=1